MQSDTRPIRLADRLRRLVEATPPGGRVLLPVDAVRQWLDDAGELERAPSAAEGPQADLTVQEIADLFDRKPNTVRDWLEKGKLRGYKFNGREWRVTRQALREFQERQRRGEPAPDQMVDDGDADLGAWRKERSAK